MPKAMLHLVSKFLKKTQNTFVILLFRKIAFLVETQHTYTHTHMRRHTHRHTHTNNVYGYIVSVWQVEDESSEFEAKMA